MGYFSCPECGGQCNEQDVRCTNCGLELVSLKRCEECGALIYPGKNVCSQCGCPAVAVKSASIAQQSVPDNTVLRVITTLIAVFLAAAPFFKLYSLVLEKWQLSVFDIVTKTTMIYGILSKFGISLENSKETAVMVGVFMLSALFLLIGYVHLLAAIFDIGYNDPNRTVRFWHRISNALLGISLFTVTVWIFLCIVVNAYINNIVPLIDISVFGAEIYCYLIMALGLIFYILSRSKYNQYKRHF